MKGLFFGHKRIVVASSLIRPACLRLGDERLIRKAFEGVPMEHFRHMFRGAFSQEIRQAAIVADLSSFSMVTSIQYQNDFKTVSYPKSIVLGRIPFWTLGIYARLFNFFWFTLCTFISNTLKSKVWTSSGFLCLSLILVRILLQRIKLRSWEPGSVPYNYPFFVVRYLVTYEDKRPHRASSATWSETCFWAQSPTESSGISCQSETSRQRL